jgi:hypothetical protein
MVGLNPLPFSVTDKRTMMSKKQTKAPAGQRMMISSSAMRCSSRPNEVECHAPSLKDKKGARGRKTVTAGTVEAKLLYGDNANTAGGNEELQLTGNMSNHNTHRVWGSMGLPFNSGWHHVELTVKAGGQAHLVLFGAQCTVNVPGSHVQKATMTATARTGCGTEWSQLHVTFRRGEQVTQSGDLPVGCNPVFDDTKGRGHGKATKGHGQGKPSIRFSDVITITPDCPDNDLMIIDGYVRFFAGTAAQALQFDSMTTTIAVDMS